MPRIGAVPRRLAILGSTGSIGVQAIDVVERSQGELQVVALSADSAWEAVLDQAQGLNVKRVAL
jgi:1-deoxy-D-xylulose-5-phosphate reductoisomerase